MVHSFPTRRSSDLAEKFIRIKLNGGSQVVKDDDCFSYKIIGPIYNFINTNADYDKFLYITSTILWCITMFKLYGQYKSGELQKHFKPVF